MADECAKEGDEELEELLDSKEKFMVACVHFLRSSLFNTSKMQ